MRRFLPIATLTLVSAAGNAAFAQRGVQGPALFPPSPNETRSFQGTDAFGPSSVRAGSGDQFYSSPYYLGGSTYDLRPTRPNLVGPEIDREPIRDPQMAQIAQWYRDFFNRPMAAVERNNWEIYLRRDGGNLDNVLVQLLGGDEFYKQTGANFDSWLRELAQIANVRLSRGDLEHWRNVSRGSDRLTFAREFLGVHGALGGGHVHQQFGGGFAGHGHDHGHGQQFVNGHPVYGTGSPLEGIVPIRGSVAGQLRGSRYVIPHYLTDRDRGHGQQHSVGFGPRGNSPEELVAGWYRTYFGREIAPGELNKWMTDVNKGMAIDEVYASVLAAPEWYTRSGGSPQQWIASTLAAIGQPNDSGSVNYWLDRFHRTGGNRFEIAKEMVRARPQAGDFRNERRRDRRFDRDD